MEMLHTLVVVVLMSGAPNKVTLSSLSHETCVRDIKVVESVIRNMGGIVIESVCVTKMN